MEQAAVIVRKVLCAWDLTLNLNPELCTVTDTKAFSSWD